MAEVTNTPWGERVVFSFEPSGQRVPKALHVSPLMDMLGDWDISATHAGDEMALHVNVVGGASRLVTWPNQLLWC